ncbi:hypothetical protein [Glutamicibacter arilaitensis]|uniref:hypothetical protein n=1 Tax=Glutamicibacter arilaitensis TaxID=256701 RepID=UPI003FD0975B
MKDAVLAERKQEAMRLAMPEQARQHFVITFIAHCLLDSRRPRIDPASVSPTCLDKTTRNNF